MPLVSGKLRLKLKDIRDGGVKNLYRYGNAAVHYRVLRNSFGRENSAVFSGIREHHRRTDEGSEVFELRRRIHMIEKGLTMKPRRDTFATGYILMVLGRLRTALAAGVLGDETIAWARDVLNEYFEATETSSNAVIVEARRSYASIHLESDLGYSGPATPSAPKSEFDPELLHQLAAHRRSVRWYVDRPVDRNIVDRAASVALEAPTACNRVPYQLRIFDDPRDARLVASLAGGTAGYVHNLQSVAVVVGDLSAYVDERDRHLIYIDGSLAAMGFIFSLEASGVSSCCINWPDLKTSERAMAKTIGLQPFERVVMLIAFGYADPEGLAPASPKFALDRVRRYSKLENDD
jgi:nitroreductase